MKLTVQDLIDMRELDFTRILAGRSGLSRSVLWAHSCEMADPWTWLGRDELLMTVGLSIPTEPEAQLRYLEYLDAGGLAGMILGPGPDRMLELATSTLGRADELSFPILTMEGITPFSVVARVVAIARTSEQVARVTRLNRLYERARLVSPGDDAMLDRLAAEVGHALHVVDLDHGTEVLSTSEALGAGIIETIRLTFADQQHVPARIRLTADDHEITGYALPGPRRCALIVDGSVGLDALVVQHALSLIGVEYERTMRERERRERSGETLLRQLLAGSIGSDEARYRIDEAGIKLNASRLVALAEPALPAVRLIAGDESISTISAGFNGTAYLICNAEDSAQLADVLSEHSSASGFSAEIGEASRIRDAAREARWALESSRTRGTPIAEYASSAPLFLPRTTEEARFAARVVLSSLIDHDEKHETDLLPTLREFLSQGRSWKSTSESLQIHRQTLGYRIKKIEQLTGRSTRSSEDIAFFWMALISLDISAPAGGDSP